MRLKTNKQINKWNFSNSVAFFPPKSIQMQMGLHEKKYQAFLDKIFHGARASKAMERMPMSHIN